MEINNFDLFREEQIKNGVPTIELDIFNSLDNLVLSDDVYSFAEYLLDEYLDVIGELENIIPEDRKKFLDDLKRKEIINNQLLEGISYKIIKEAYENSTKFSLDEMMKMRDKNLNPEDIVSIHDLIVSGTDCKKGIRKDNSAFVWGTKNGEKVVDYLPIDCNDINKALNLLSNYCNFNNIHDNIEIFIKPIITHGLIASLQLFDDGNARTGRMFQNAGIWGLTSKVYSNSFKEFTPVILSSKQYEPYYSEYRGAVLSLVKDHTSAGWNSWILFNLARIEENLNFISSEMKYKSSTFRKK